MPTYILTQVLSVHTYCRTFLKASRRGKGKEWQREGKEHSTANCMIHVLGISLSASMSTPDVAACDTA